MDHRPTAACRRFARRPDGDAPTALALAEWREAGLEFPDLPRMRLSRLDRLVAAGVVRDLGGLLLFDPLSIRYATDPPTCRSGTPATRSAPA
jgi:hypothetical protein